MTEAIRQALMQAAHLIADALEKEGGSPEEWVDQLHSPLGRRRHCELVRAGKLPGYKPNRKRVLVRRSDLDAYIEKHPVKAPPASVAASSVSASETRLVAAVAKTSARLGLIRVK